MRKTPSSKYIKEKREVQLCVGNMPKRMRSGLINTFTNGIVPYMSGQTYEAYLYLIHAYNLPAVEYSRGRLRIRLRRDKFSKSVVDHMSAAVTLSGGWVDYKTTRRFCASGIDVPAKDIGKFVKEYVYTPQEIATLRNIKGYIEADANIRMIIKDEIGD